MRAALSLGANLGDRRAALDHARVDLLAEPGLVQAAVSSLYEADPVGGVDQPDFLNAVLVVEAAGDDTDADAVARRLLAVARRVEGDLRRVRGVRWGPRTLDVDVLAVGGLELADPELTVPHPRLAERAFVLVPWAEADPGFVVPGLGSVAELLAAIPDRERRGVRLAGGWT